MKTEFNIGNDVMTYDYVADKLIKFKIGRIVIDKDKKGDYIPYYYKNDYNTGHSELKVAKNKKELLKKLDITYNELKNIIKKGKMK